MTINSYLKQLELHLGFPYPERKDFLDEIKSNYFSHYDELIASGFPKQEAHEKAFHSIQIENSNITALEHIHNTELFKTYSKFTKLNQHLIELTIGSLPFLLTFHYIKQEVPMMDLIQQGGAAMWPIIIIGTMAILFQLKIIFSWLVAKNHTQNSLSADPKLPMILGTGCFLIGFLGTLLGLYNTFTYADTMRDKMEFSQILSIGFSESIVNLIFATSVLLIVFTLHFFTKYTAKIKKIPA